MNLVPAFLEDFFCFREGNRIPGTVDVTLPKITPKSVTASGAGIAGDMDMPTKGQTENMETGITFRTTTEEVVALSQCKSTLVEFRGAQFVYNTGTGEYEKNPCAVVMRIMPKETDLGKFASAESTESKITANVAYLKVTIDGKKMVEIDKFNYIHYVYGTDYLADVRSMLGL